MIKITPENLNAFRTLRVFSSAKPTAGMRIAPRGILQFDRTHMYYLPEIDIPLRRGDIFSPEHVQYVHNSRDSHDGFHFHDISEAAFLKAVLATFPDNNSRLEYLLRVSPAIYPQMPEMLAFWRQLDTSPAHTPGHLNQLEALAKFADRVLKRELRIEVPDVDKVRRFVSEHSDKYQLVEIPGFQDGHLIVKAPMTGDESGRLLRLFKSGNWERDVEVVFGLSQNLLTRSSEELQAKLAELFRDMADYNDIMKRDPHLRDHERQAGVNFYRIIEQAPDVIWGDKKFILPLVIPASKETITINQVEGGLAVAIIHRAFRYDLNYLRRIADKVVKLSLSGLGNDGTDFDALPAFTALKELDLRFARVEDRDLPFIAQLPNLQKLTLPVSGITAAGLEQLKNLSNLRELEVADFPFSKADETVILDEPLLTALQQLAGLKKLVIGLKEYPYKQYPAQGNAFTAITQALQPRFSNVELTVTAPGFM